MLELRRRLDEIYARHTGQPAEQVHDDMERDRYLTAEEAVNYGLADRIVERHELRRAPYGFRGNGSGEES